LAVLGKKHALYFSSDLMAILKGLRPNKQKNQLLQATSTSLKTIRKRGQMKDIEPPALRKCGTLFAPI